ncbi:I20L2 protein, partial [Phaetusa simplex]|nr:I20L2 protein [Phaetusa simplex]
AATRTPAAAKQTPTTASRTPTATNRPPAAASRAPTAASRTPTATTRPPAATTRPPASVTASSTAVTQPTTATQNGSPIPKGTNPKASACGTAKRNQKAPSLPPQPSKMVAIDCEMVGTGPGGRISDLARCSIVNYHGD